MQKSNKFGAKLSKKQVFKVCTKMLVEGFIPPKNSFFLVFIDEFRFLKSQQTDTCGQQHNHTC